MATEILAVKVRSNKGIEGIEAGIWGQKNLMMDERNFAVKADLLLSPKCVLLW